MRIRTKFAIFYIFSAVLINGFMATMLYFSSIRNIDEVVDRQMSLVVGLIKELIVQGNIKDISKAQSSLLESCWLSVFKDGNIIYENEIAKTVKIGQKQIRDGATLTIYTNFVNFTGNNDVILHFCTRKLGDGRVIAMGYIMDDSISNSFSKTLLTLSAAIFLVAIAVYVMLIFLLRPLGEIGKILALVNEEKLDTRLEKMHNDEIGDLIDAINTLLSNLQSSFNGQRHFLSLMSHELKTPLAILRAHMEQAMAETSVPIEMKEKFSSDIEQICRLNDYIAKLLLLTRLEENSISAGHNRIDLSKMIEQIGSFFTDVASGEDKQLNCDIENNIHVLSDADLLYRAIFNFCDNAIKFSPNRGIIYLGAHSNKDGSVTISIGDAAGGIPEGILRKLEQKFFSTDASDNNILKSQIGLRLSCLILRLLGLTYKLDSQMGIGSKIEISIPKSLTLNKN